VIRVALALMIAGIVAAQPRTPVVVELFTSEGCSSCPPADRVLARLERASPLPGIEVIALAEHVDYWNQLGWQDRFSSPLFSGRQQDYGRAMRMENVYTPQMIVNGRAELLGSDFNRAVTEIERAAQAARARVELSMSSSDTMRLRVDGLPSGTQQADMLLAVTESGLITNVAGGENSGQQLRHPSTVRSLTKLGRLDAKKAGAYTADAKLMIRPDWRRENLKLVLFVQDRSSRRILGAAAANL